MTLDEMYEAARSVPLEVRAGRRRAVTRRMQRLTLLQRERERSELGYRDLGGEG